MISQAACNVEGGEVTKQTETTKVGQWRNSLKPKGEAAHELTLAVDGKTDYVIVVPAKPTTQEQKAADELVQWLKEITGAAFPIVPDTSPAQAREISVGRTSRLTIVDIPAAKQDMGEEGYAIAVQGERLFLLGGSRRGPIYAAFALLEEDLGCRWYTSESSVCSVGARGVKRIPNRPTLKFSPVPRSYVPVFDMREPYYTVAWDATWSLRNRTNAGSARVPEEWGGQLNFVPGMLCHTTATLMPPSEYFEEHPEYFMMDAEGKRIPKQPCLTNPAVLKIITENVRKYLKKNPNSELISVSYGDGQGHCKCENCKAVNDANESLCGTLLQFVNQVAEAVEKEYPNVMISTLAYVETFPPPTKVRARHNVSIHACNTHAAWRYPLADWTTSEMPLCKTYREGIRQWSKICDTVQIWDYPTNYSHFLAPLPNMHALGPAVRFYADNNVKGLWFQGVARIPGGARAPMRAWMMAKVFWDPSLNVRELERDFVWGNYGKAAPAIEEYYDLLASLGETTSGDLATDEEKGGNRYPMDAAFLTPAFIEQATALLDRAERLAEDEQILHRVELARTPIMYVKLMRGPEFVGQGYLALIDRFETIARREDITQLGMHSGYAKLDPSLKNWRDKWLAHDVSPAAGNK